MQIQPLIHCGENGFRRFPAFSVVIERKSELGGLGLIIGHLFIFYLTRTDEKEARRVLF